MVDLTHRLSEYKIPLKQGQNLLPIDLEKHRDPVAIIGILLHHNSNTYTRLNEMCKIGRLMVLAGLTIHFSNGHNFLTPEQEEEEERLVGKRVTSMCVEAALANDDFETAYSYVMNKLINPGSQSLDKTDDWSWRASLQAGKYRRNAKTKKPTHVGNASANPEIRHLEQRMDCLSQALTLAPKSTLAEILNVFRRCEEELATQMRLEEEEEAAHDDQGDRQVNISSSTHAGPSRENQATEDTPISLFDLGRRSAENAKRSLVSLRASQARNERMTSGSSSSAAAGRSGANNGPLVTTEEVANSNGVKADTIRKRDQLRNAAVGTLATGIGWLINAPPVTQTERRDEDED